MCAIVIAFYNIKLVETLKVLPHFMLAVSLCFMPKGELEASGTLIVLNYYG